MAMDSVDAIVSGISELYGCLPWRESSHDAQDSWGCVEGQVVRLEEQPSKEEIGGTRIALHLAQPATTRSKLSRRRVGQEVRSHSGTTLALVARLPQAPKARPLVAAHTSSLSARLPGRRTLTKIKKPL
jgi:hypothetical protein